jgi:hypothetical protein
MKSLRVCRSDNLIGKKGRRFSGEEAPPIRSFAYLRKFAYTLTRPA